MRNHPPTMVRLLFWSLFMAVLALPSMVVTIEVWSSAAMVLALMMGTACWVLALAGVSGSANSQRLWASPAFRKVFWWVFGLRVLASVALPVGIVMDAIPGLISFLLARHFGGVANHDGLDVGEPLIAFMLTVFQGFFLQLPFWFVVFVSFGCVPPNRRWPNDGLCIQCGYDLRASKDTCPECGTPILKNDQ